MPDEWVSDHSVYTRRQVPMIDATAQSRINFYHVYCLAEVTPMEVKDQADQLKALILASGILPFHSIY